MVVLDTLDSSKILLDPRVIWRNPSNERVEEWRETLKNALFLLRGRRSDYSGKYLVRGYEPYVEMHEGILTRANVPKGIEWSWMIYHEMNCLLLLPEEHRPIPPSREWCINWAYELYGRWNVHKWYYSLPFKAFPFELP
jgi:hypothetical protein